MSDVAELEAQINALQASLAELELSAVMTEEGFHGNMPVGPLGDDLGDSFSWDALAFGYAQSGAVITIHAGSIRLHGIGNYSVAEDTVTLTGATEWVYVQQAKTSGAATIEHSATEPLSNTTYRKLPLYLFEATAGVYSLSRICHMGDFNFDAPIA